MSTTAEPVTPPSPVVSTTVPPATALPTTSATPATGDLADPDVRQIELDGELLLVAWADDLGERSQGLRGVTDLGDLDGMLFDMGGESSSTFTMSGVPIALDIYFFGPEGESLGMLEMETCLQGSCPSYSLGVPFHYALEVPAASLPIGPSPRLRFP